MAAAAGADQDIMKATGISEAGLGFKSNETSGKAILARQREGDTSTYHLIDNCARSVKQTARVLLDIIPNVYDVEMTLRILDESGEAFQVQSAGKDGQANPLQGIYQLGVGTYDVVVSSGASYNTRRQESAAMLMELAKQDPQLMQTAGDLIIGTLDIPGGEKLVERLKAANPLASGQQDLPPDVKQHMDEQDQMVQQLQQQLQQAEQELQSKQAENQLTAQKNQIDAQKVQVEQFKAETERERMQTEMSIHAAKEDVPSSDKLNHAAELAIKLKQMEIDHAENIKLFAFQKEMDMVSHKAACDMGNMPTKDEGDQEEPQTQNALAMQTAALAAILQQANKPKEAVAVRDNSGVLIGVKTT
jgi:hypothetical protein